MTVRSLLLAATLAFILNHDAHDMPAATHGDLSAAFTGISLAGLTCNILRLNES